eukprot:2572819-Pleurochrysis_carterae.AAC.1
MPRIIFCAMELYGPSCKAGPKPRFSPPLKPSPPPPPPPSPPPSPSRPSPPPPPRPSLLPPPLPASPKLPHAASLSLASLERVLACTNCGAGRSGARAGRSSPAHAPPAVTTRCSVAPGTLRDGSSCTRNAIVRRSPKHAGELNTAPAQWMLKKRQPVYGTDNQTNHLSIRMCTGVWRPPAMMNEGYHPDCNAR